MAVRSHPAGDGATRQLPDDDNDIVTPAALLGPSRRVPRSFLIGIAAFLSGPLLAGCHTHVAPQGASAAAVGVVPRPRVVLTQAETAPSVQRAPAPSTDSPVGLPRVRDYEPVAGLRDIHFDFGKAVIRAEDVRILDANAAWLRANPAQLVLIEGHCDNRGAARNKNEFNMDLGERRAQAAMKYLIAQGIDQSRITILSYGEERPKCTEQNERCWSENRRSRFLVKPR